MVPTAWLLDSDPSIRWQVMRDLTDASPAEVAAERSLVATEGWGAELLALQADDGHWDGGTYRPGWVDDERPFFDAWTATHFSLAALLDLGLDPASDEALRAVDLVATNVRWPANGLPYFDGETEPCINGTAAAVGAYFGRDVSKIVEALLDSQLPDGGWNCWAEFGAKVSSFHSTMCALDGLRGWESSSGPTSRTEAARHSGEEYLLRRGLFRRLSSGEIADPRFTMFSFPTRWYYDTLRALDYFRTGGERDPRLEEAIQLVESKRTDQGVWPLDNVHQGPTWIEMEGPEGFPSRWTTLRAMRVLRWWKHA